MAGVVESAGNAKFKLIKSLEHKKYRDETGLFIMEGESFVRDIPENAEIKFYAVSRSFRERADLAPFLGRAELEVFSDALYKKLSSAVAPQGVMAICAAKTADVSDMTRKRDGLLLILLDGVNDPGNLGTIIRTAAAVSADGVVISANSADVWNPKVLRATASVIFSVSIATGVSLPETAAFLKSRGIKIYGSAPSAKTGLYDLDYRASSAFVIGNEARGISPEALELCDDVFKIPMDGNAESLNAAIAAAIIMYETKRQRLFNAV